MANATALLAVQATLYATLDVPAVTALAPVFDLVPQGQGYPYIEIGELEEVPSNTFRKNGREVHASIHVFSDSPGYKEAESIIEQLNILLDMDPSSSTGAGLLPSPTGWVCWLSEYELGSLVKELNVVEIRHAIVRYHFEVSQP
jgi:hypothetical protein